MNVTERNGEYWVVDGDRETGPFQTNVAAWSWVDKNTYRGRDDTDRHNRIRDAFNGSYEPLR
jgi:hypothetical protein